MAKLRKSQQLDKTAIPAFRTKDSQSERFVNSLLRDADMSHEILDAIMQLHRAEEEQVTAYHENLRSKISTELEPNVNSDDKLQIPVGRMRNSPARSRFVAPFSVL